MKIPRILLLATTLSIAALFPLIMTGCSQQSDQTATQGGGRGGGRPHPDSLAYADYTGWTKIWDDSTLNGWSGNTEVWKVADGTITATSTCENPVGTTYLIWQGGQPGDFELKAEVRAEGPGINGGIQYRSYVQGPQPPRPAPTGAAAAAAAARRQGGNGGPPALCPSGQPRGQADRGANAEWNLQGPQFDIDGTNRYTGQYYQSGAPPRFIPAFRGQVVEADNGQPMRIVALLGSNEELGGYVKVGGWNQVHIIARGHTLVHMLNGHVMSVFIDNDSTRFRPEGMIGVQIEGTGTVSYRNIYIKQ